MFGGSWITTVLVICPFLVVAAVCLPIILFRYIRGDFKKDKDDEKQTNDNYEVK